MTQSFESKAEYLLGLSGCRILMQDNASDFAAFFYFRGGEYG